MSCNIRLLISIPNFNFYLQAVLYSPFCILKTIGTVLTKGVHRDLSFSAKFNPLTSASIELVEVEISETLLVCPKIYSILLHYCES